MFSLKFKSVPTSIPQVLNPLAFNSNTSNVQMKPFCHAVTDLRKIRPESKDFTRIAIHQRKRNHL